jgi:hypothetical protein
MGRISTPNAIRMITQMDTEKLIGLIGTDDAELIEKIRPAVCWAIESGSPTYLPSVDRNGPWDYIAEVATSRIHLDNQAVMFQDVEQAEGDETVVAAQAIDVRSAVDALIAEVRKEGGN